MPIHVTNGMYWRPINIESRTFVSHIVILNIASYEVRTFVPYLCR